ncbi:MAG: site-specific integrase [Proteobacteria bacterium]|nr:site-specific integrase [Pseudomonadota bacterium]
MNQIFDSDIDLFRTYLSKLGRQPATVESYGRDSKIFLDFLNESGTSFGDVSAQTLTRFQEYLIAKGHCANSVRRSIIGIRQLYRFLQDSRNWSFNPLDEAVIPEREFISPLDYDPELISKLISNIQNQSQSLKNLRDLCLVTLLGIEGLKITELIELTWTGFLYASDGGRLRIEGPRSRIIGLESQTTQFLQAYRTAYRANVLQSREFAKKDRIMLGFKGIDSKYFEPFVSRHGVKFTMYELGKQIQNLKLNSELLRHNAIARKVALGLNTDDLLQHFGLRTLGNIGFHLHAEHQLMDSGPNSQQN